MDTIRLDFDDPTWSNVDVAIWNMIESHIGSVAANIPLMGPLITLVGRRVHFSTTTASSKDSGPHKQGLSKGGLGSSGTAEHRFRRMRDDGSGDASLMAVEAPTGKGEESTLDDE